MLAQVCRAARLVFCFLMFVSSFAHCMESTQASRIELREMVRVLDEPHERIDAHLSRIHEEQEITPSALASSEVFLRRSFLDLIGRPPTLEEINRLALLPINELRVEACNYLLEHDEYAEYWGRLWETWLLKSDRDATLPPMVDMRLGYFVGKLKERDADLSAIFLEMMEDLTVGSLIYYFKGEEREDRGMAPDFYPLTEKIGRTYLGTHIGCVRCHDDFLEGRFTQSDFWELNAYFGDLVLSESGLSVDLLDPPEWETPDGEARTSAPSLMGRTSNPLDEPLRMELSKMIVEDERFSVALVNRYWNQLFGYGLNHPDPYDHIDLDDQTNPMLPLLRELALHFERSGYNPRELLRWVCQSRAYARTSLLREGESPGYSAFSRMEVKPLTEEQLVRVIRFHAQRAESILGPDVEIIVPNLDFFTRANYRVGENRLEESINPHFALEFLNGDIVSQRLIHPIADSFVWQWKEGKEGLSEEETIENLFYTLLSRAPRERESRGMRDIFSANEARGDKLTGLQSFFRRLFYGEFQSESRYSFHPISIYRSEKDLFRDQDVILSVDKGLEKMDWERITEIPYKAQLQNVMNVVYGREFSVDELNRMVDVSRVRLQYTILINRDRPFTRSVEDIVWALVNSSEFLSIP